MDISPAALAAATDSGGATIGIPILILLILFYLVSHKGYKVGGILLAFVAGVMLSGTSLATSVTDVVDQLLSAGVNAIEGLFN